MAKLWSLLHNFGDGTGPIFIVQITLYWTALLLVAAQLLISGRRWASLGHHRDRMPSLAPHDECGILSAMLE